MSSLPPPRDLEAPVAELVAELTALLGRLSSVTVCLDLLEGAPREDYLDELPYLTGLPFGEGAITRDRSKWQDYWVRVWGARGLLYVWDDIAIPAVVAGLAHSHWRPAEMCLKVSTRREIGEAGPGAAALLDHGLARVRSQAARALGAVGDTEHVDLVLAACMDSDAAVRRAAGHALQELQRRLP